MHISFRLKKGHQLAPFLLLWHLRPASVRLPFFSCRKSQKNIFYMTYPLHFTRTQTSRYITGFIHIRGRTEMIYGRMGRKDFRPLAFESLLALTCGKKMSNPLHCCSVRCVTRWFYSLLNGINIGCKIRDRSCDLWSRS